MPPLSLPILLMVAPFARTSQSHSHVTHFLRGFSTAIVGPPLPSAALCLHLCLWYCNVHNRIFMTPSLRLATPERQHRSHLPSAGSGPGFSSCCLPPLSPAPIATALWQCHCVPSLVTKSCEFYRPDVREVCVACGLSGFAWDHEFHTMVMAALALTTRVYCAPHPAPFTPPLAKVHVLNF